MTVTWPASNPRSATLLATEDTHFTIAVTTLMSNTALAINHAVRER